MDDLMLDLETLSTSPNAAVTQIGACFFDRKTGDIGDTFSVKCIPNFRHYDVDFSTVKWWTQQSEEARQSVFSDDAIDINAAVLKFAMFLDKQDLGKDFRVWAMPSTFDVVIMEHAFKTEGLNVRWRYNAARDVRTVLEIAGFGKEDRVLPEVAHDALSDAVAQAKTVAKAFEKINART